MHFGLSLLKRKITATGSSIEVMKGMKHSRCERENTKEEKEEKRD